MLDLYVSRRAFVDSLRGQNDLTSILKGDYVNIHAADKDLMDKLLEPDSYEQSLAQDNGWVITSGVDFAERVKAKGRQEKLKIRNGLTTAIFVLDGVTPQMTREIERKLGVICIADNTIGSLSFLRPRFENYFDRDEDGNWEMVLADMKSVPLNSIIVNDHYLQQYKEDAARNLEEVLTQLMRGRVYDFPIQVLFIFGKQREYVLDDEIKRVIGFFDRISKKTAIKFKVETINCTGTDNDTYPLYKDTHERFILTNYGIITADYSIAAFTRDRSCLPQTVVAGNIFADGFLASKRHKKRKSIVSDINKALSNSRCEYRGAVWEQINNEYIKKEVTMDKLTNKLIADLQGEDSCWYLSVPNQNDWAKCFAKHDIYDSKKFAACICRRNKYEVDELADKIHLLFMDPPAYLQVKDDAIPFFRINISYASDIKTIDYKKSSENEKASNQFGLYHNNCFANEDDAVTVANKICDILGIQHISKH